MADLFASSAGVNGCWCMWPLRPPRTHEPNCDRNKAEMRSLLLAGQSVGLLAIRGGQAIGWCACGPRHRYPQYDDVEENSTDWAIPCLYIDPKVDREEAARALIEAAKAQAKQHGAGSIEGPPPWWLPGDAEAILLATETFVANGFAQIGQGSRMPELRLELPDA